jgi:phage terminase large subunit-like protein
VARRRKSRHPVDAYAEAVLEGKIAAGQFTRLACERHLRDLATGATRGLYFDYDAADHALEFFRFLRHSKGEWAGCVFHLEPWQQFIVGSIFGWMRADGTRRFRTAFIECPRKQGKSTLAAGVGLYLFIADGEPGSEVYSAATKRDQAKIVWDEAANMVKRSPALAKRVRIFPGKANMHVPEFRAKFEPLGADADTLDGLNVHGAIIDELHAHKTRNVWDVLETATSSRRQPLVFTITTAGTDQNSICYEQHEYACGILKDTIQDDTYFAYIATIDEGDDWKDPRAWAKANPNLGVSVKLDDLERKCEKAKKVPAAQNAFKRLHLCVWVQQVSRWIDLDLWDQNAGIVVEEELRGRTCYGGLDLSSVSDITAWVLVFPHEDDPETVDVLARFWVPEARLHDDHNRYREQYRVWARQGWLKTTPGEAIDYAFVKKQILEDARKYRLVDMNIDRLFQAHQLAVELEQEGLTVVGMGQGFMSMAAPMKEFERRLLARKIRHGGNPVLRWMADCVAVKQDPAGNLKPDKASSQGRIDGIVALVMALDRAMRHEKPQKRSVYEERGLRSL